MPTDNSADDQGYYSVERTDEEEELREKIFKEIEESNDESVDSLINKSDEIFEGLLNRWRKKNKESLSQGISISHERYVPSEDEGNDEESASRNYGRRSGRSNREQCREKRATKRRSLRQ